MHAVLDVHCPTLFSMRQLGANSMAARTLPCPTPAALKMAVLSALLWRDGEGVADEHLGWLARLGVAWRSPARLGISACTVHVLKDWTPSKKKGHPPAPGVLEHSVGMREYVSFSEPFGLALLDVPDERR